MDVKVNEVTKGQSSVHLESPKITCWRQQRSLKVKETPKNWGILQPDYQIIMDLQTMAKVRIRIKKKFSLFKWVAPKA